MGIDDQLRIGIAHHQAGRLAEAERIYRDVLALHPQHPQCLQLLGVLAQQCGNASAAVELISRAIAIAPHVAAYHNNLGEAYRTLGQVDLALAAYQRALQLQPLPQAHYNAGLALADLGRLDEAVDAFRRAIALHPQYAKAYRSLGTVLAEKGPLAQALQPMRTAVELDPADAEAWANLAGALSRAGDLDGALQAARRGVEVNPASAQCRNNLAGVLEMSGALDEASAQYQAALRLDPAPEIHSNLIALASSRDVDPTAIFAEHRQWAHAHADPLSAAAPAHESVDRAPDRLLRIGYVSPDLRDHPVARFLLPALRQRDRQQFHVTCYSSSPIEDDFTAQVRAHSDQWLEVARLSDAQLAGMIRADAIDILIDLAGHTSHNRLLTFARRPAPVQVSYLGYPDTTGMSAIDWRISDQIADPQGMTDQWHTERVMRLERCAWCFDPPERAPEVASLPQRRQIRFGTFNRLLKISPRAIEIWSRVLKAAPQALLVLKAPGKRASAAQQRLIDHFAARGIDSDRLLFIPPVEAYRDHLAAYAEIDVALDTMPYAGTMTTCEALWMGVPVVTLAGERHIARVGASLLTAANLSNLVAQSPEEYVQLAIDLAADVERRRWLGANLRDLLGASPLLDARDFARHLDLAYRHIWTSS